MREGERMVEGDERKKDLVLQGRLSAAGISCGTWGPVCCLHKVLRGRPHEKCNLTVGACARDY